MTKKNDSRKINALLPLKFLRKHVINRSVAISLRNYLSIILFSQVILLIMVLFLAGFILEKQKEIKSARDKNYSYWLSVVNQYPNEPDILFNAGKSAYESGKKEIALKFIEKALQIDPLFEKAIQFKKEIGK